MKYIITGGSGFIGSNLAKKLIYSGNEVVVVDDHSTGPIENIVDLMGHPNFSLISRDVLSFLDWDDILESRDNIVHLAATVGVDKVYSSALDTLNNNFQPTSFLLKQAVRHDCKFFFSSTSEVYGELNGESFCESDSLVVPGTHCGRSAYVLGKIMSEQYCINYARQFKLPVIIGRFFNVAGNNQISKYGMVVPTFVEQALHNRPITIFGDGTQTRSFCNVLDVVDAIIELIGSDITQGEIFNIGGTERITMNDLASYIKESLNSHSEIVHVPFPEQRANGRDVLHRCANIDKIRTVIGWKPQTSWTEIIDELVSERIHH